ncbi:MAG: sensor histidine kinase [Thiofilum sp.]|uniref:sensor histidine kinase n=1 Tax=Thiofilum sp. TaxID=2212733 RepID=UPI0025E637D5|nr:sensor histidine kinase [Thiofilum sp.]MBK8453449.1 sensor histidine kinase [Thiofilum sp.]
MMTRSLQAQLQWQLAITLILVMGLMWLIGYTLPRPTEWLVATQCLNSLEVSTLTHMRRFQWLFPFMAVIAIGIVLLVQSLVIRHSFKRFQWLQTELKHLETGKVQQLSTAVPSEIQPLVQEINHLIHLLHERLERSRHALGNLAHALKTPLNLLLQQLDQESIPALARQVLELQVERIRQLTERELKRARMAGMGNNAQRFDAHTEIPPLLQVLKQIYSHNPKQVTLSIPSPLPRFGDREDMLELLGNLLDNAFKWAKQQIHLSFELAEQHILITIEDDGAGLDPVALTQLTQRGIRLDESVSGHGLGLGICQDITKLYGGHLSLGRSTQLGGFKAQVAIALK